MKFQIETDLTAEEFGQGVPVGFVPIGFRVPTHYDCYVEKGHDEDGECIFVARYNEKKSPSTPKLIVMPLNDLLHPHWGRLEIDEEILKDLSAFKFKRKIEVKHNKIDADFEPSQKEVYNDDGL